MRELQSFKNKEFGQVRTLTIGNNPYFVGADITRALGYKNSTDAIKRHCKGVVKRDIPTRGGNQKMNCIPEGDLYRLIVNSELPNAEKFEEWVFDEVLPTIRKHGMYATDELINNPDLLIKVATALKEERAKRVEAERFNKQIAVSQNSLLVREVAKIASKENVIIGEKRLWKKLREWGLIFKKTTEPMQEYVDRGYFEVVEGAKETYKGTFTYRTTRVTGKGQVYIIKRLIKEQEEKQ